LTDDEQLPDLSTTGAFATLIDVLALRAQAQGPQVLYTFLVEGEREGQRLTYGDLDRRARAGALRLLERAAPGDRALLVFPPGLAFIEAFFACLYAGIIAVPAYPPTSRRTLPRLRAIARDAQPRLVLGTAETLETLGRSGGEAPELARLEAVALDNTDTARAGTWQSPPIDGASIAFLQYTSGSTADPKGVQVSHRNLLHNQELIRRAFEVTARSVVVGWLPLFHDMGLIGNVLQPLYAGARCVLLSPLSFLKRPRRWLEAVTRYRGTLSGGPNFAYELVLRRVPAEDREGLDLSSWRVAFNGAEPVRAATLDRFAEGFAPQGFHRQAFLPCYGLAEATLFVTGGPAAAPPVTATVDGRALEGDRVVVAGPLHPAARRLVASGRRWEDQAVVIADPESARPLPPGRVGEVWVAGPSVAEGYYRRPEQTARDFAARLADGRGPYLRTGDLGFLDGGQLFVTGRLKDLVILRGRNLYPQDLERSVEESHPALHPGGGAAFAVEADGEERLVVVQEVDRRAQEAVAADPGPVLAAVQRAVAEEHEAQVFEAVLIAAGSLPKTSSGKVRRQACRSDYLAGRLVVVARSGDPPVAPDAGSAADEPVAGPPEVAGAGPAGPLKPRLRWLAAAVLRRAPEEVPVDRPLTALGLDSLAAVELQQAAEDELGLALPLQALLEGATLRELAADGAPVAARPGTPVVAEQPPLPWDPDGPELPLSPGQRALWFLERLAPGGGAYHIAAAAWVDGALDPGALGRALAAVTRRHPALRATFHPAPRGPLQRIHPHLPPAFTVHEAPGLPDGEARERLREIAYAPFDLETGPPLRAAVLALGPERHALVLVVHHLVADFASLASLVEELEALYAQEIGGPPAALPPLEATPGRVLAEQERRLAGPRGAELARFWRDALREGPRGLVPDLELPTDRPRPPVMTYRGDACGGALGPGTAAAVDALAARAGVTRFVVLAAAWGALLGRLAGQRDFALGTPVATRESRSEGMVGYLVNPVALRVDLAGAADFAALVARLGETVRRALVHRELPFPRVTEVVDPPRDPGRSPLFQVLLTLHRAQRPGQQGLAPFALGEDGAERSLGPLVLRSLALPRRPAQLDLALALAEGAEGLAASLSFNTDLFDATTARRWLDAFRRLLAAAVARPETPLPLLPVLSAAERRQLLVQWNDTAAAYPEDELLHERVFAQAKRCPEAPAVVFRGETWSYRRLAERAHYLARRLLELGVGPETAVGIHLSRSPEMVAAALSVLEAGGQYLPLDPAYPAERLAYMLEDSGAPLLITEGALAAGLAAPAVLRVDDPAEAGTDHRPLPRRAWPESPAYLIYTSGSTGRPKGVQVPHRAVGNFLESMARRPGLGPADTLLSVTTLSFDIAALELYLPLTRGARVVLADALTTAASGALAALVGTSGATVLQATPSTWRLLMAAGLTAPGLKALAGGEALAPDLAQELLPRVGELWNVYGPTETTIWSAVERVVEGPVTLGGPIANTELHVVDGAGLPVPVGVAGELWIGGAGVARGYFRRPGLTAERFVPDPCSGRAGARLYRTGDRVRRRGDGRLEYLGRLDHQVKLRGHRIELAEVEAALAAHPAVAQAVAVVRPVGPGDERLTAYLVAAPGAPAGDELVAAVRARAAQILPPIMVPSSFVVLERLPTTPNGKLDRKALPAPAALHGGGAAPSPRTALEETIAAVWRDVLQVERVGLEDSFFDLGGHSLLLAQVHARLEELGHRVTVVDLFRHPTVRALARFLGGETAAPVRVAPAAARPPGTVVPIAIVGRAGRFPRAPSVDDLWARLAAGEECITFFTEDELAAEGIDRELLADPAYVRAAGYLEGADRFDAGFFGITPREAELMDPQHRVFLEVAWHALEDAGCDPARCRGGIGVFAGAGLNTYLLHTRLDEGRSTASRYQAFLGNDKDFLPTRVAYKLDLRGPAVNVQTACSTSLVAVHLACRSLAAGECDLALAGGVAVRAPLKEGYLWEEGGIPSPDGHCRVFDAEARGTVFGSGAGLVVLKRLDDALAQGDTVHAVIRGSAINNDGADKIGYTAPGVRGQAAVVAQALAHAGVAPETVSYVEAHGTGTTLGDPIEVEALTEAFGGRGRREPWCVLGSVKSNLGHLDTAAGIAGLIKTVEALRRRELPPTLHFATPNPKIDFATTPFFVAAERRSWEPAGGPRRAGVSSFGIGGTNAHLVLEEAPAPESPSPGRPWQLLAVSAKTPAALEQVAERLARHLEAHPEAALPDVAFTLLEGRAAHPYRRAVVARDPAEAAAALRDPERSLSGVVGDGGRSVAFLFSGQGSQHPGMGRELYDHEPLFRAEIDRAAVLLREPLGLDLRALLYPQDPNDPRAAAELEQTAVAQPALFAVEHALARLYEGWGLVPAASLGHSVGEFVAATRAGVFTFEEALRLVAERGRLLQALPPGAMLSVTLGEEELLPLLPPELALAAVNGPDAGVVSGPVEAVARFAEDLAARGIEHRRLHTSHAFHSPMMEPAVPVFRDAVAAVGPRAPERPFVSSLTGAWITAEEARDPGYWARQLREPVRFAAGVAALTADPERVLLEVGPGRSLADLARRAAPGRTVLASLPHPREPRPATAAVLAALGRLWVEGVAVDTAALFTGEKRRKVPLPLYPFAGERHWLPPRAAAPAASAPEPRRRGVGEGFWVPLWRQTVPPSEPAAVDPVLLVEDGDGRLAGLARRLGSRGHRVVTVTPAAAFRQTGEAAWELPLADPAGWERLWRELAEREEVPDRLVYGAALGPIAGPGVEERFARARERCFDGLVALVGARERVVPDRPGSLLAVADGLHRVAGQGTPEPLKALLLGPLAAIPLEHPALAAGSLDVLLPPPGDAEEEELWALVAAHAAALPLGPGTGGDRSMPPAALRGGERWVRGWGPLALPPVEGPGRRLREGGVYLITGGLGGLGLAFARDLARRVRARLVLLGRGAPALEAWERFVAGGPGAPALSPGLLALRELAELGAEVLPLPVDVTDRQALARGLARVEERFGPLHGVIHAAGAPGGGLLARSTPAAAERVIAPKVLGTLVLEELLADRELDFFALCSSLTAVTGAFGQGDYAAANAFLDSFAQGANRRSGRYTVALGWDRWEGIGMAAAGLPGLAGAAAPSGHPLLGRVVAETPERDVFHGRLAADRDWVVAEHRIAGRPTVPGATYLELARAAFARRAPELPVTLSAVAFLSPLAVPDGEEREVMTVLDHPPDGTGAAFRVLGRAVGAGKGGGWVLHAQGSVAVEAAAMPEPVDLAALTGGPRRPVTAAEVDAKRGGFLVTGRRWESLVGLEVGEDDALAHLTLPPELAGDLEGLALHPALLDIAVGAVQFLAPGHFLPLAYERLTLYRRLPGRAVSHLRRRPGGGGDLLSCDATVYGEDGVPVLAVEGFSMRRMSGEAEARLAAGAAPVLLETPGAALAAGPGLTPEDGVEAFARVLAHGAAPHLVVCLDDLPATLARVRALDRDAIAGRLAGLGKAPGAAPRPATDTAYAPPGDELEGRIAVVWQRVLGISRVGIHDNFFELGGTSLSGVQLIAELKRELGREIPQVAVFEAPTVAAQARYLRPREDEAAFAGARERARQKAQALAAQQASRKDRLRQRRERR
jgi:amino acid adenylation domain-containing protein